MRTVRFYFDAEEEEEEKTKKKTFFCNTLDQFWNNDSFDLLPDESVLVLLDTQHSQMFSCCRLTSEPPFVLTIEVKNSSGKNVHVPADSALTQILKSPLFHCRLVCAPLSGCECLST